LWKRAEKIESLVEIRGVEFGGCGADLEGGRLLWEGGSSWEESGSNGGVELKIGWTCREGRRRMKMGWCCEHR